MGNLVHTRPASRITSYVQARPQIINGRSLKRLPSFTLSAPLDLSGCKMQLIRGQGWVARSTLSDALTWIVLPWAPLCRWESAFNGMLMMCYTPGVPSWAPVWPMFGRLPPIMPSHCAAVPGVILLHGLRGGRRRQFVREAGGGLLVNSFNPRRWFECALHL